MRTARWLVAAALLLLVAPAAAAGGSAPLYSVPVWFNWDQTVLDVVIVPPAHGPIHNDEGVFGGGGASELTLDNAYLAATLDSVAAWDTAIAQFGSAELRSKIVTNVYVAGRDSIPMSVWLDPEIVIVSDEWKATALGLAISSRPCIVDNSKFFPAKSFTYADMFNVNGQEYGHCLGLNHTLNDEPNHDVMTGHYYHTVGARGTHLHCPSNLDVAALELVFSGREGEATVAASDYTTSACT